MKGLIRVLRQDGKSNRYALIPVGNLHLGEVAPEEGHQVVAPPSVRSGPTDEPVVAPPSVHNQSSITREKKHSPQGDFVTWFKVQYQKTHGKPYVESKADFIRAAELLKLFKIETLQGMVPGAWSHRDAFIQKCSMSVKGFCSIVNSLPLPKSPAAERELTDEEVLSLPEDQLRHRDKARRWKLEADQKKRQAS